MTQEELDRRIKQHSIWLQSRFNPYPHCTHCGNPPGPVGKQLDLRGEDASGLSFAKQSLNEAIFSGAKLVGADFRESDLTDAEMDNCDLRGARFTAGAFQYVSLRGADLTGVILYDVDDWIPGEFFCVILKKCTSAPTA